MEWKQFATKAEAKRLAKIDALRASLNAKLAAANLEFRQIYDRCRKRDPSRTKPDDTNQV